jgi:hypothetical protein
VLTLAFCGVVIFSGVVLYGRSRDFGTYRDPIPRSSFSDRANRADSLVEATLISYNGYVDEANHECGSLNTIEIRRVIGRNPSLHPGLKVLLVRPLVSNETVPGATVLFPAVSIHTFRGHAELLSVANDGDLYEVRDGILASAEDIETSTPLHFLEFAFLSDATSFANEQGDVTLQSFWSKASTLPLQPSYSYTIDRCRGSIDPNEAPDTG